MKNRKTRALAPTAGWSWGPGVPSAPPTAPGTPTKTRPGVDAEASDATVTHGSDAGTEAPIIVEPKAGRDEGADAVETGNDAGGGAAAQRSDGPDSGTDAGAPLPLVHDSTATGDPDGVVGIHVDDQKLRDPNAYFNSLPAPRGDGR
jgi:hypothetical protein